MGLEGITKGIKNFYFDMEDKWYALIDKIDSKVPIHGIVDRIDKVVPSFLLFIIIVVLLIAILVMSIAIPSGYFYSFKVTDSEATALENAEVNIYVDGQAVYSGGTNEKGESERFYFAPGTKITVVVSKSDFLEHAETIEVSKSVEFYPIILESLEEKTYTISLKDILGQPIRAPLTLSFTCRNPDVQAPEDMQVFSGVATVTEPAGCNGLIVSVRGEGYEFKSGVELVLDNQSIYLLELLGETGTINVELYFNGQLVSQEITVYLYKRDSETGSEIGPIETTFSSNGIASFERQPGIYFAKTSGMGNYAAAQSDDFSLSAGDVKTVRVDLERNVVGTISLRIVDERTGGPVDQAKVLLRLGPEEIDNKESSSDDDGIVEFPVSQDIAYTVIVDHEGYCLKTVHDVTIGSAVREIELKPFTDDCGAALRVKVLEQDGQPVRNATVGLYNEDGFSIGFAPKITDLNGIAEFTRVPSGDYQAFAFKARSSGWSEVEHFVQRAADQTILTVVLIAGDGAIKVNVRDDEGMPLQFANVAFVDALTHTPIGGGAMPVQDINGTVELTTRADKWVYIVASKPGYTNFTSIVKPVIANTTQVFDAVLEKGIIQGDAKIEFKGVFKGDKVVSVLAPGEEYDALFELRIPANKSYDSIGMHVRTGKNDIMELDKIVIDEINAPGLVSIIKATSFSQSNGYAVDSRSLASDEAKWANLRWDSVMTGKMQVMVSLKVKETATIGDQLNLYYRSWAVEDGSYKRDPVDTELGEAESVAGKEGLYANTKKEIFQIGFETFCDTKFCFSATIRDVEDELSYESPDSFSGKVYRQYELNFTILNNSEFDTDSYLDADLRISSGECLALQNYRIYGAQSQLMEGKAKNDSTDWIAIGNMLPNDDVFGTINFVPQNSGLCTLTLELRSGQRIRFSKSIYANIAAGKEMDVSISPKLLPSGVENSITVTAKDSETSAEIEKALVKVKDRFGTVVAEATTNSRGVAMLTLPALQPGEKLFLTVGKPDYETFETTIEVNPDVIKIEPSTIGVALNAKTIFETQDAFTVENVTSFDMKIKEIELNGKLYGLVDREKVNNWLYSYVGETIMAGETKEMALLSFLTEKGKDIEDARQVEASLDITVEAFSSEWSASVPVKINIGLGGEVDDPNCFTITRKEWKAGTEGVPIEVEFEVQNNCSVEGTPIEIRDISAKVDWESNQVGTFSVRTATNALDLREGYYKMIKGGLAPEEKMTVVLSFTPNAGVNGKGVATVYFSAKNPIEGRPQILEDSLSAEITVVNLIDCISFSRDILLIKPEDSDTFVMETVNCGPNNRVRLESELTVSQEQFTLSEKESKEIEVFSEKNMAGQYPIKVYVKGSDEVQEKLIKTIRARILAGGCLELSKYEFDVFDNPNDQFDGYDTAEIINHCYDKHVTVNVKFDEHDWMEAMKTGAIYGLIAGVIGGFGAKIDGTSLWTGSEKEAASNATTWGAFQKGTTSTGLTSTTGGTVESVNGTNYFNPEGSSYWYDSSGAKYERGTTGGLLGIGGTPTVTKVENAPPPSTTTTSTTTTGTSSTGTTAQPEPEEPNPQAATDPCAGVYCPRGYYCSNGNCIREPLYTEGIEGESFTPTGMATLGMGEGMLGGVLGNLVFGMGKSILGKPSALGWGLQGFIIGTLVTYFSQDEGEFSFPTIQKDLQYKDAVLLLPGMSIDEETLTETPSTDIVIEKLREEEVSTMPSAVDQSLNWEKRRIYFWNKESVVQPDPATPFYRTLRVDGERIEYITEYDLEEEEHPTIEEKERKDHKERFRLQFNAFDPLAVKPVPRPLANCTLGTVTGVTGPSAVPKVAFDWSWDKIKENSCDEGNQDYIYCDATQFSIEILKKVQKLKDFIESNRPFSCPSGVSSIATKEQPLKGTAKDIGITKMQASKIGENDVNLVVVVESNNGNAMDAELTMSILQNNSLVKSCTKQFGLISRSVASCEFTGLAEGIYEVQAGIMPSLCAECENNDLQNDSIDVSLVIGASGVSKCEPYNTERLVQFMEASNYSQQKIEEIQKLVKFNAYLIKDAYTNDFRADFDLFCKTKSFFDCPTYYLEEDGLHEFFSDNESFKFDYSLAPLAPADAGKYSVTLNIEFDNENWDFFSNGTPDAVINVEMTELAAPEPDSPFYYLPLDGLIGVDTANGRQGYGVNFRQTSEETIKVNNTIDQTILSTNIAGSTPIFNGWIDAGFADDFGSLNDIRRGILLDVQARADSTKVTLSPSYATPIMMQVDYEKGSDAYGFYSVEIDNSPQTAFLRMVPWSGVGVICRDFLDNPVTEAWQDTWDIHGGISGNIDCAIGTDITDYGVEWCNPIRSGSVYLQSVIFTPQGSNSIMKRTAYGDDMTLYNVGDSGGQIALNGVPGMANNSYGTSSIDSIEDIFDLVEENRVCLVGQGSRVSNQFFWNLKNMLEEFGSLSNEAEQNCIQAS